jgi:nicotinamide-nucleotide amidase
MNDVSSAPTCEIITIGSELLLGQIMDTNTTYLAQELGHIGVNIRFRTAVGDRLEEIAQLIEDGTGRCDMVITTGGLGPTLDDLTREAVARVAGVELEFRQDLMDQIEQVFRRAGYQMSENNRRQAFVPKGSHAIPNPVGTAPGFIREVDGKPIICLPGVPRELKFLLGREVTPWVRQKFNLAEHIITYRVLKTAGIGESKVDSRISDLMGAGKNPEVGLLASMGEIKIRIAARARDLSEAELLIRPIEGEIRSRLGEKIFGQDDETLQDVINAILAEQGLTLGILETFTGGFAALKLHQLPSSQLLESYTISDKERLLQWLGQGVRVLENESASTLASRVKEKSQTDVGLAILGFPEEKEEGYALIGYAAVVGEDIEKTFSWQMGGDLLTLQERGTIIGLNTLRLALLRNR